MIPNDRTQNDRIQIRYRITFQSPFHLGTGVSAGAVDRTVIRDTSGYLYVPASTFKGVLREHCERLWRFALSGKQVTVASPHDMYAALGDFRSALTPTISGDFRNTLAPIHRIFGSSLSAGTLYFDDAHQTPQDRLDYESRDADNEKMQKGKYKGVQTSISTQVRIDRLVRIAVNEALYTSEFGIPDLTFEGTINGWLNCVPIEVLPVTGTDETMYTGTPTYSLLLLLASFQFIEQLGGNKSAGKGRCVCDVTELKIYKKTCTPEQQQYWLEHLGELTAYSGA